MIKYFGEGRLVKFCQKRGMDIHLPYVIKNQLPTNLRMHHDEIEFDKWLLNLGNGRLPARVMPLLIWTLH